jgi:3-oxoacyl-[acyl-carrier protein] reductase
MPDPAAPELSGLVAVVTGSASGIGRAIARTLAAAGADVLVHARNSGVAATELAEEFRARGRKSGAVLIDLAHLANQDELVESAWDWQGRVDIWVNNAGADVLTGAAGQWPFERKLEELLRVDVTATMRLSRLVGARMKQRGSGVILNMGWDQAHLGMAGDSGELFAAAKGAIMANTRSLALSLAPEVRVNCLAPGWIKTGWGESASDYWQQRAVRESALGRWGTPEDVAAAACFLASPAAGFVTGQVLSINGGFRAGT